MASQKPGIFFQAEAVFFPFRSTEQHLLIPGEGRFLPLNTGAFQDQVVFRLDGTISKKEADDAAHSKKQAHDQQDGILLRQGINASKQDTEKADCTDGSQPGE